MSKGAVTNIYASKAAPISELKKHPMSTVQEGKGEVVAILNRNEPVFYCVPAKKYEEIMNKLEDTYFAKLLLARAKEKEVAVDINEL